MLEVAASPQPGVAFSEQSTQLSAAFMGDSDAIGLAEAFLASETGLGVDDYLARVDEIAASQGDLTEERRFFPAFWISLEAAEAQHDAAGAVLALAAVAPAENVPIGMFLQPADRYPAELQAIANDPAMLSDVLGTLGRLPLVEVSAEGTTFEMAAATRRALLELLGDARPSWASIAEALFSDLNPSQMPSSTVGPETAPSAAIEVPAGGMDDMDAAAPRAVCSADDTSVTGGDTHNGSEVGEAADAVVNRHDLADVEIIPAALRTLSSDGPLEQRQLELSHELPASEPLEARAQPPASAGQSQRFLARLAAIRELAGTTGAGNTGQAREFRVDPPAVTELPRRTSLVARLFGRN